MRKPFDATMRKLIEMGPAARLRFLHISITRGGIATETFTIGSGMMF